MELTECCGGTHCRSRSSACALARAPASHQLFIPATNVIGMSFAGGNALIGAARDGSVVWVAVAVADMMMFLRAIVGRIIVKWGGIRGGWMGCDCGAQVMEAHEGDL